MQVIFVLPTIAPTFKLEDSSMESTQLQTITISSTSSVLPVRGVGRSKPLCYTKGARTFAGSMVFTVLAQDPFQRIANVDALNNTVRGDGHWHIDQMAPFDAIIMCTNEMGESGMQIIHDITLTHWGTTFSVEDIYIESTYTYVAEHVTPFISTKFGYATDLVAIRALEDTLFAVGKTPDDAMFRVGEREAGEEYDVYGLQKNDLYTNYGEHAPGSRKGITSQLESFLSTSNGLSKFVADFDTSVYKQFSSIFGLAPEIPQIFPF